MYCSHALGRGTYRIRAELMNVRRYLPCDVPAREVGMLTNFLSVDVTEMDTHVGISGSF